MFVDLWREFENFQIGTIFWSVSGNFQHVSGNFDRTKIIYLFSIRTQQISRLLKVSSVCTQVSSMFFKISRFLKTSVICPEICSMSPGFFNFFFLDEDEYYYFFYFLFFSIICQKNILNCKNFTACIWNFFIAHKDNNIFLSYDTKIFRIAQKFPDSNATLLPGFFSLCCTAVQLYSWTTA